MVYDNGVSGIEPVHVVQCTGAMQTQILALTISTANTIRILAIGGVHQGHSDQNDY